MHATVIYTFIRPMTSHWCRYYTVKAVHIFGNSDSTSHSIISRCGLERFVYTNCILIKLCRWKLGGPVIMDLIEVSPIPKKVKKKLNLFITPNPKIHFSTFLTFLGRFEVIELFTYRHHSTSGKERYQIPLSTFSSFDSVYMSKNCKGHRTFNF